MALPKQGIESACPEDRNQDKTRHKALSEVPRRIQQQQMRILKNADRSDTLGLSVAAISRQTDTSMARSSPFSVAALAALQQGRQKNGSARSTTESIWLRHGIVT
ncbi:MAG TPA: hypothetical protein VMU81_14315 [Acetobacteraceae bacterium]|nr:hypothetical protein [Acetobacteraceae bacterium]